MKSHREQIGRHLLPASQGGAGSLNMGRFAAAMAKALCFAALAAGASTNVALAANPAETKDKLAPALQAPAHKPKRANFEGKIASGEASYVADWVVDSGDNRGMPFVIVDKVEAIVYVFDASGRLSGSAPALLGLAQGDGAVPGIGERALSSILPEERTTPAGRFVAALGRNMQSHEILWVDYKTAISLHPVVTGKRAEQRAERLSSPTPLDNRISYGCINVPVKFFKNVVSRAFKKSSGIVYVLPEGRPAREIFAPDDAK
jgi:hypothetical protein